MQLTTTLRPSYQLPIYNAIPEALREYKYIIVQSPAGSGKSVIMSHTVARIIATVQALGSMGKIPLVLTHRTTIQGQLLKHCDGISIDANVEHVFINTGHCYVAMTQTLVNRPKIMSQLAALKNRLVIIIDECHFGQFNKVLDLLPDGYRVGFSATPAYKWAKHLPKYYRHCITGPQISTLIEEGDLVPFDYYEMQTNLDGLRKSSTGDYTEQSQFEVFDKPGLYDGIIEQLHYFDGKYSKGGIFCSSIKHCDKMHLTLTEAGFNPVKYHSDIKDKKYQKARFEELNESNLMVSVSGLAEGWDYPPLDFEVLYRATASLPMYIQIGMRCSRPSPGKSHSTVLDFGGNNTRFGGTKDLCSMIMDRDWSELWQPPKKVNKSGGVASIKECPLCSYLLYASSRSCCNCGYMYPEAEVQLKVGELVRIQEEKAANDRQVSGRKASSLDPIELAYYAKNNPDRKQYAIRVAKANHVQQIVAREANSQEPAPTWLTLFGNAMGYKQGWADRQIMGIVEEKAHVESEGGVYDFGFTDIVVQIPQVVG